MTVDVFVLAKDRSGQTQDDTEGDTILIREYREISGQDLVLLPVTDLQKGTACISVDVLSASRTSSDN